MRIIKSTRSLPLKSLLIVRTTLCLRIFGLTNIIFYTTILNRSIELISVIIQLL
nr:MAG TPA: hypothetical protein [Caudoviricetes sp.]